MEHFHFTPLHVAVLGLEKASPTMAFISISRPFINQKDAMGRTALCWSVLRGDVETVHQLLANGADPNIGDKRGSMPLHHWVSQGSIQVLGALLDAGADIDAQDVQGRTTLMELLRCRKLDENILEKLFATKPDIDRQGIQGCTPWHPVKHSTRASCSKNFNDWLIQNKSVINARTIYDRTPLMSPAAGEDHRLLGHFLTLGADYSIHDSEHRSLLHIAADYGDINSLNLLRRAKLKLLCTNSRNSAGNTPMDIAIWRTDENAAWSRWAIREPDQEPQKWFKAFQDLYNDIKGSQEMIPDRNGAPTDAKYGDLQEVQLHVDDAHLKLPGAFPVD